jgi:hypothetical protein
MTFVAPMVMGVPSLFTISGWHHIALPALNLSLFPMAMVTHLTRAGVQENLRANYIRFAHPKGLTGSGSFSAMCCRAFAIPIITVMGIALGVLLAFGVVTETVFGLARQIPGTVQSALLEAAVAPLRAARATEACNAPPADGELVPGRSVRCFHPLSACAAPRQGAAR